MKGDPGTVHFRLLHSASELFVQQALVEVTVPGNKGNPGKRKTWISDKA